MKRVMAAAFGAALMLSAGPALAHTGSGSHEEDVVCDAEGNCTTVYDNDVSCGDGTVTPAGTISAGGGDAEVCADGSEDVGTLQGRIWVSAGEDGVSGAADGDADNSSEQAQGFARADVGSDGGVTITCGDENGDLDSTHPGAEDGQEDCG